MVFTCYCVHNGLHAKPAKILTKADCGSCYQQMDILQAVIT